MEYSKGVLELVLPLEGRLVLTQASPSDKYLLVLIPYTCDHIPFKISLVSQVHTLLQSSFECKH